MIFHPNIFFSCETKNVYSLLAAPLMDRTLVEETSWTGSFSTWVTLTKADYPHFL
jgi:hypothetical protein